MEQFIAPMPGRTNPRWSRLLMGGAVQTVSSPALIAGLPASSAMVCVGPPLLASPAGSSSGFVLHNEVPFVVAEHVPFGVGGVPVQSESAEHPSPGKSPPTQ
jgi:hypothetical protein